MSAIERNTSGAILDLDRIRVAAADFAAAAASMEKFLGYAAEVGEEDATIRLSNMSLEIIPSEQGAEGLCGLAFTIDNAQAMHRTSERRALHPTVPVAFAESNTQVA